MKHKKIILAMMTTLALLAFTGSSQAILNAVSIDPLTGAVAVDPVNGYPLWYQDTTGLALSPCLTEFPSNPGFNPYCVLISDPGFNAAVPLAFPTNWPIEFFYWVADADKLTAPAGLKVCRFSVEGSFATPGPVAAQQTAFQRIRIWFTPPNINGTYVVTHPFGTHVFTPADFNRRIGQARFTFDVPFATPLNFTGLLDGPIGPLLKWDTGLPLVDPAGNQYIGNPLIAHTVTGSPFGTNYIQIDGPDIGGLGINTARTNLFTVAGKIFPGILPTPLIVDRTTYSRDALGQGQVDLFALSSPTASVTATGGPNLPAVATPLQGDVNGSFLRSILPAPDALTLPASMTINAGNAGNTPVSTVSGLTDIVTVSRAEFDNTTGTFTVEAFSSDQSSGGIAGALPTLTAVGYITPLAPVLPLPPGSPAGLQRLVVTGALPPPEVTVASSGGGSHTVEPVVVLGTSTASSISGTVTDTLGNPVIGAALTLSGAGTETVLSDAAGNYGFAGLIPGTYTVAVSVSGYSFVIASRTVTVGPSATGVNFVGTLTGFSISGTATSRAGGLSGVTITVTQGAVTVATTTTALSGAYIITGLAPGFYTVTPSLVGTAFSPVSSLVTVGPSATGVNFFAGFTISGTVTLGGVGQAGVILTLTQGGVTIAVVATDATGAYAATGLAAGTYTVTPRLPAFVYTPLSATVTVGPSAVVNFTAAATFSISGTVISGGVGLGGVTMTAASGGVTVATAVTALSGAYTLTGLTPGVYTVTPSRAGFAFTPPSSAVTITAANVISVNFTGVVSYSISGVVKTAIGGFPASGVTINLTGPVTRTTTTAADGTYSFGLLGNGVYTVMPVQAGHLFSPTFLSVTISNSSKNGQNFTRF